MKATTRNRCRRALSTNLGHIGTALLLIVAPLQQSLAGDESPHTFSANVLLGSEYVFRGISNSNEDPTIQGGFDYAHASGFYLGTWASNIEYNAQSTDSASVEIDFYGGLAGSLGNGIGWDIGALYYWYPEQNEDAGAGDYNFFEIYGVASYTFASVQHTPSVEAGVSYSPDFFGEDGDGVYLYSTAGLSLPYDFSPYVTIGYQDVEGDKSSGPNGFDYFHYAIGLSKAFGPISLDLSWHDADLDGCDDLCKSLVFSISSSW